MIQVSRQFQNLTHSSPKLQCRRELFAAGLTDNPHDPCGLDELRRLCKEYVHKWSDPTNMMKSFREMSLEYMSSGWCGTEIIGRNLLARPEPDGKNFDLFHIPPVTSRKPIERWNIPSSHLRSRITPRIHLRTSLLLLRRMRGGSKLSLPFTDPVADYM